MRNCLVAPFVLVLLSLTVAAQHPAPLPNAPTPQAPSSSTAQKAASAAEAVKPTTRDYTQESFVIEQMHSRYRFESDRSEERRVGKECLE